MRLTVIIILTALFTSCCSYNSKDFDFNADNLRHFSSFKQGDTIFYESSAHDIDTILIVGFGTKQNKNCGSFMAQRPINEKWIEIMHLPIDRWHGTTQDGNKPKRIDYQKLFWISKSPTDKTTEYKIDFKDFHSSFDTVIGEYHTDALILNNKKISNYYLVSHAYPERIIDSKNIECVYWTEMEGLVAYKNKAGEIWTKKSNH